MESSTPITLDHTLPICIDPRGAAKYHNEFQLLNSSTHGLNFLYQQVRVMELWNPFPYYEGMGVQFDIDWRSMLPCPFPNLGCCFQWYSVTLQNLVELIGCIGKETCGQPSDVRKYAKDLLGPVEAYRDNVGGHFGRAQTGRNRPNHATRIASLMPPSGFHAGGGIDGRYFTHSMGIVTKANGTISDSSVLQPWSLTMKHEELASRFWPNLSLIRLPELLARELQEAAALMRDNAKNEPTST